MIGRKSAWCTSTNGCLLTYISCWFCNAFRESNRVCEWGLGLGWGVRCNSAIGKVFKDYVIQHKIVETQELESRVTRICLLDGNFSATGLGTCTARKVVPSCEL